LQACASAFRTLRHGIRVRRLHQERRQGIRRLLFLLIAPWRSEIDPEAGKVVSTAQLTHDGGFSGIESADARFIYYSKDMTLTSLWRMPVAGGKEEPVVTHFAFNRYPYNLAAGKHGLYFRGCGGEHGVPVYFLPFTGPATPRQLMTETVMPAPGLAVSPDERLLLLTVYGHGSGEILAIKDFR